MRLILIRHGRTLANRMHLYCGSTDVSLSEEGRMELMEIASGFRYAVPAGMRILTSGRKRCEETLTALFGDLPHEQDPDFAEMDFGVFEMRSYDQLKDDPVYLEWITGDNESKVCPGGESGVQMTERVLRALQRLEEDGRPAMLITHGGVIAAIMAYLFPDENRNRYEWQPPCGMGYVIDTEDRIWEEYPGSLLR